MNYNLLKEVLGLVQAFEHRSTTASPYAEDLMGFKRWVAAGLDGAPAVPQWEGQEKGRSPESVINTLLLRLSRYARAYSKAAIHDSDFSTQEEFIYLINLKAFGAMTKMALIKQNVQEKPAGMQIINRLIAAGWITQTDSETDKRSKVLHITPAGLQTLEAQMDRIRQASRLVAGDLTPEEQMTLIRLLTKLDTFHHPVYCRNIRPEALLQEALSTMPRADQKKP